MDNRDDYYNKIKEDKEAYIQSLGTWTRELEQLQTGRAIYDTMSYPGDKPLAFHLDDMRHKLKHSPERSVDTLSDNAVVKVLKYFVENAEDRMQHLRESKERTWLSDADEHEEQVYRELSTNHKTEYLRKLLLTIQSRKTQYYESSYANKAVVFNENMYVAFENIAALPDDEKNTILDNLLLQLPNQSRDYLPDIENIEQLLLAM